MSISGPGSVDSQFAGLSQKIATHSERIASGVRINGAEDDAAGLVISERMSRELDGYQQSIRNANDGVSMLRTAEAGLAGVTDGLARIRELALQAGNSILNQSDRDALNSEAQMILSEIDRTLSDTTFNQKNILNSDQAVEIQLGTGTVGDENNVLTSDVGEARDQLQSTGLFQLDIRSLESSASAVEMLDAAQQQVDGFAANLGASLNRLDSTIENLYGAQLQTAEAKSRISDADMAKEISGLINSQAQNDIALAVKALANQQQGNILKLLQP